MSLRRIKARTPLRRATLVVAMLFTGTGAVAAMDATGPESTAAVARILPSDRSIALIESLEPANGDVSFVVTLPDHEASGPRVVYERLNICIPCEELA